MEVPKKDVAAQRAVWLSAAWGPHFLNKQNGGAHEMGSSAAFTDKKYGSL